MMKKFSVVVPVFDEVKNVAPLHKKIVAEMKNIGEDYEIIFIDDASTDGTLEKCKTLSPLILVALRRNSGQSAAMDAGVRVATGEYLIFLDGDGQNDPVDIKKMFVFLQEQNLDLVCGWRKDRKDPFFKRLISRGAFFLRQLLVKDGIHDSGCTLKIARRGVFDGLELVGEMHRFIPAMLRIQGFSVGEMVVSHHARKFGITKYNWRRTLKGFLDMLSLVFWQKFVNRPMHFLGGIGLVFFALGLAASISAILQKILLGRDLSDTSLTMMALFFFFFGIHFFILGILFDITTKIFYSSTKTRAYAVREIFKNS